MNSFINASFTRPRVVALLLVLLLTLGAWSYVSIPKENAPEIPIPVVYVITTLDGISPEDSERLLAEPLETELSSLTGLKEIKSIAGEGFASVTLEFKPGFDADQALQKVREAVDRAQAELPSGADESTVHEVNTALFPILNVILSGPIPERTLNRLAERLKEDVQGIEGVLSVDVGGSRTELLEVVIDPTVFETYDISFDELIGQISRNNLLVAAGAIESDAGRLVIKIPGLIEDMQDLMELPIKTRGATVVTFSDVATIRRTFEDPTSFARINGQPALALEVKKRIGANIIETVAQVKEIIEDAQGNWPDNIKVTYLQDESKQVQDMLSDLEANVIAAIVLVMIVIVYALGFRSAILVGLSIPGAFLTGVTALWFMGYTMNFVVLFSLILVVGMLVDGAIVTIELADRQLQDGATPKDAYRTAAQRMAWPVIASAATTLSVFLPLLFWAGTIGEFMKYLPITVMLTLGASLFMALIFIPVMGSIIGKRSPKTARAKAMLHAAEYGDPRSTTGVVGFYIQTLEWAILRPFATVMFAVAMLLGSFGLYGQLGKGVTFFPSVEPDFMQVTIESRDGFSIRERDALVRQVEDKLLNYNEITSIYANTSSGSDNGDGAIGTLQLELAPWDTRRTAEIIGQQIRDDMLTIAGVLIQVETENDGPSAGKPVNLRILSSNPTDQMAAITQVKLLMQDIGGFTDISDTGSVPGVEWRLSVNRTAAARAGADISLLGQAVQMLTQGITVAKYRPDDADGSVDIRVRFPAQDRTLEKLQALRIPTSAGLVPISDFVSFDPAPATGSLKRIDQKRVLTIEANIAPGLLVDDQITALSAVLETTTFPDTVTWSFAGEAEEQAEAMAFLIGAFIAAIALMFVILVTQFNSFYQAFVVMSAIVFSITGVLLGLLITGRPFGVVMGGIGIIALAGIVVNNNIVLIDTYNSLKKQGQSSREAALRTGALRLRPVVLTSLTTALGLMPMVFGLNIDFFTREIIQGAPSTQWWTELSSAIAGGLVIATLLTLLVTPAMLMLGERRTNRNQTGG